MMADNPPLDVAAERSAGTTFVELEPGTSGIFDLGAEALSGTSGAVWALSAPDLNVNLVMIQPGEAIDAHVNNDVDVLLVVESGRGELSVDGSARALRDGHVALIPKGAERSIRAIDKLAYFSIHARRS